MTWKKTKHNLKIAGDALNEAVSTFNWRRPDGSTIGKDKDFNGSNVKRSAASTKFRELHPPDPNTGMSNPMIQKQINAYSFVNESKPGSKPIILTEKETMVKNT